MLLSRKYYAEAMEKAKTMDCPECWKEDSLEYISEDDCTLVCSHCHYSVEDYDLNEVWIEAYCKEYGVDSLDEED